MDQACQLEPLLIWVDLSYPLCRLEGVDNIGDVDIRIRLINKLIQLFQDLHQGGFKVVKL